MHSRDSRKYSASLLCGLFGVTKQAYYKYDETKVLYKDFLVTNVLKYITEVRGIDPGIGGLKLWMMYEQEYGIIHHVGRDKFEDIIDKYNLKVRKRTRICVRTTDSSHNLPLYPNLIWDYIPSGPNKLWVSDITYIPIWDSNRHYSFSFLSIIMDSFTKEIIGWCLGDTLETCYPIKALQMALKRLEGKEDVCLIHHSDRGCQYASTSYTEMLKANGIKISMTECGDPKDNAQAERINNTVKNELLKGIVYNSMEKLSEDLSIKIDFYNYRRPHMSLNMMTPAQASMTSGEIQKKWRSYREEAIKNNSENLVIA